MPCGGCGRFVRDNEPYRMVEEYLGILIVKILWVGQGFEKSHESRFVIL